MRKKFGREGAGKAVVLVHQTTIVVPVDEDALLSIWAAAWRRIEKSAYPCSLRLLWWQFGCQGSPIPLRLQGPLPLAHPHALGRLVVHSATPNGSPTVLGPGKHDTHCQGSPLVHVLSFDAASSIRNWISNSSHASWLAAFSWRRYTVCR